MLEKMTREAFEGYARDAGLSGAKGILKEIYDAKATRGKHWDEQTICKVERFESFTRKILQMKGILTKKEQGEFSEYMKGLQKQFK